MNANGSLKVIAAKISGYIYQSLQIFNSSYVFFMESKSIRIFMVYFADDYQVKYVEVLHRSY